MRPSTQSVLAAMFFAVAATRCTSAESPSARDAGADTAVSDGPGDAGPGDAGPDPCAPLTDGGCRGCTLGAAGVNCGWCARDNTCKRGVASISLDGTCTGPDWRWTPGTCVTLNPCRDATDCASCIARGNCGWCAGSNQCLTGIQEGPDEGMCPAAQWTWQAVRCP